MTQLEDLLRSSLAATPTPATSTADPLGDLDRRVARARRRLGTAALASVAVLVAAIVVPLSVIGGGTRVSSPKPAVNVPIARWPGVRVSSMTVGGGFAWTLSEGFRRMHSIELLQRRDPATGQVLATYHLPAPLAFMTYGLGELWVWGGGDGGYPSGRVAEVSTNGQVRSNVSLGKGRGLTTRAFATGQALAFVNTYAYGVQENGHRVVTLFPGNPASARGNYLEISGAQRVLLQGLTLYVIGANGVIQQNTESAGGGGWGAPLAKLGLPLTSTATGFWALVNGQLVQERTNGSRIGSPITLPATPTTAVAAPGGGVYVAFNPQGASRPDLMYFDAAAVRSAEPRPTALHRGPGVDNLVLDPAGGVVVQGHGVGRWDPAGAS